jgi:hypothetical protein
MRKKTQRYRAVIRYVARGSSGKLWFVMHNAGGLGKIFGHESRIISGTPKPGMMAEFTVLPALERGRRRATEIVIFGEGRPETGQT